MRMANLEAYVKYLEENHHPAAKIGRVLLESNSGDYLLVNLKAFVEVVERDVQAERAFMGGLLRR
jgi:hypothetical protein